MKKFVIILVVIVLVCTGGYVLYKRKASGVQAVRDNLTRTDNLYTVAKGSVIKTISSNGFINPLREKNLNFKTTGRVKTLNVKKGDYVEQGDLLATLDNLSEELSMTKAQHSYEQAVISSSSSVKKERSLELDIAKLNYENTFLYAPFSGLVTSVDMEVDDQTNSSTAVIQLLELSGYILELNIDEVDMAQIQLDQIVMVTLEAFPELVLRGKVTEIGYIASSQSGVVSIPIKVEITGGDPRVKPGLSASAEIVIAQATDQVVVPITAVTEQANGTFVMKKVGDKIERSSVKTGISDDLMIVIEEGLVEGDQIVVNNYQAIDLIRNGMQNRMQFGPAAITGVRGGGRP